MRIQTRSARATSPWLFGLAAAWILLGAAPAAARDGRAASARALYQRAQARLARNTFDTRRLAMRDLEQATLLDPSNLDYQLTLGATYFKAGFLKDARERFERVLALSPDNPDGHFGLGQTWRRDWLKYLDTLSLARAAESFSLSARLRPSSADAWIMLVPLLVERSDLRAAAAAAERGLEADPRRPDAMLARGYTAYQLGNLGRADSAFTSAIPRLPRNVREYFEDISPVASARDTFILHRLSRADQEGFVRRFWKDIDPDLTTPENEAQLEYWSRVAHAYFLYYNTRRREWDERGEVYARYGPPTRADYNPLGVRLTGWRDIQRNVLIWSYPDLGMKVLLEDRSLSEYYLLPITLRYDPDPVPNLDSLAGHDDRLAAPSGRGVFHKLPPGVEQLPVEGAVARFVDDHGARLLGQIESPGTPGDSLWADWVVVDSSRTEVSRSSRLLTPSACAPTERRVADFAAELPTGRYRVGLSVRDRLGRRGVYRVEAEIPPLDSALGLSDVVIACGSPEPGASSIRIESNPGARVRGDLTAYFEIYHLTPGPDGPSRFEYVYTVRSAEKDARIWLKRMFQPRPQLPSISATRQEEHAGTLRRQFLTVPAESLPAGKYRLEVRVRDLITDAEVVRTAEFVKLGAEGLHN